MNFLGVVATLLVTLFASASAAVPKFEVVHVFWEGPCFGGVTNVTLHFKDSRFTLTATADGCAAEFHLSDYREITSIRLERRSANAITYPIDMVEFRTSAFQYRSFYLPPR